MSGRKNTLKLYQNITSGDMSTASITSAVTEIQFLDNIGIQLDFTGSPVGTFEVQVSMNYAQDYTGNVTNSGTWSSVPLQYFLSGILTQALTIPTSVGSPIYLDLNQLSAPWIRVVYIRVSGTGTLNGYITAKEL